MKKLCYGIAVAILSVVFLSSIGQDSQAQGGFGPGTGAYGPAQTIWSPSHTLTNVYTTSNIIDLKGYNGLAMVFSVGFTQANATISLKPQWGKMDQSGTNIVWADEMIISEATASGSEIVHTPYSRVISLSMDGANANYHPTYPERFNRIDAFFRVAVKSTAALPTNGTIRVDVNGLKN